MTFPIHSAYDPAAASEGTLDPLGLYQIADQLATKLVPGVRERMQRIRFLTAIAVGAALCEDIEGDPDQPHSPPFQVWEWLVVEALVRHGQDREGDELWGVPGTLVTKRAIRDPQYLDARSYLKTPRIFGFHGVYKRLTVRLGIVDVHMNLQDSGRQLVDAWKHAIGDAEWKILQTKWRDAIRRSLDNRPCRTQTNWPKSTWCELAEAFWPNNAMSAERRFLQELLHTADDRHLGALPDIWALQPAFRVTDDRNEDYTEEALHEQLSAAVPAHAPLLSAIQAYENFCRGLEDAFDVLKFRANYTDFRVTRIASDERFVASIQNLHQRRADARQKIGELDSAIVALFDDRFVRFADPLYAAEVAVALCDHHEDVQKGKGSSGKRAWFDRISTDRIYLRQAYRLKVPEFFPKPNRYVHAYRGKPIRRFYFDLK
ncbi:MAG: hypothetical protein R3C59_04130 [Planctomycetaceae bacterium]